MTEAAKVLAKILGCSAKKAASILRYGNKAGLSTNYMIASARRAL